MLNNSMEHEEIRAFTLIRLPSPFCSILQPCLQFPRSRVLMRPPTLFLNKAHILYIGSTFPGFLVKEAIAMKYMDADQCKYILAVQ